LISIEAAVEPASVTIPQVDSPLNILKVIAISDFDLFPYRPEKFWMQAVHLGLEQTPND
jgi:hypothetical protein